MPYHSTINFQMLTMHIWFSDHICVCLHANQETQAMNELWMTCEKGIATIVVVVTVCTDGQKILQHRLFEASALAVSARVYVDGCSI